LKQHLQHKVFSAVKQAAAELNVNAFVIGGFVRDLYLERPSKDIDIVVEGSGIELAQKAAKNLGIRNVNVFKSFGTAQFNFDDWDVEFVGARKESYRSDSRKPIVEDGTIKEDQDRRDFTINALALSLNEENFGELIDPFNGMSDLKNKILRTPLEPGITFSDDPLRMMRGIRFASQLDFTLTREAYDAIVKNKERIKIVSTERVTDELNKIILSPVPSVGFKLLFDTGLLQLIFPEMAKLHGVQVIDGKAHKDNFYHTLKVLDNISVNTNDLWLRWAAILHDIAKPATQRYYKEQGWTFHGHEFKGSKMVPTIFANLKLPLNEKMKYVQKLVLLHLRPIALVKETVTDSAIRRLLFDAGEDIDDLMTLCDADITSKNKEKVERYMKNFQIVRNKLKEVEEKDSLRNWKPPVTGEDIMQAFNLTPGKQIGIIKDAITEAILEGVIKNDRKEALDFMILKGKELGLTSK
jgi:putative nucleotidyltransferase with HDIG domain